MVFEPRFEGQITEYTIKSEEIVRSIEYLKYLNEIVTELTKQETSSPTLGVDLVTLRPTIPITFGFDLSSINMPYEIKNQYIEIDDSPSQSFIRGREFRNTIRKIAARHSLEAHEFFEAVSPFFLIDMNLHAQNRYIFLDIRPI